MASLSSIRNARKGCISGLTDATVSPELSEQLESLPGRVASLIDAAKEWALGVMGTPDVSVAHPVRHHPIGAVPCGSLMRVQWVFACSPQIGSAAGFEGQFELWRGHCADRFLRRTLDTPASVLLEGYSGGRVSDVEKSTEGYCRSENIGAVLLDSRDAGEAFQTFCFGMTLRDDCRLNHETRVRLVQMSLVFEWVSEIGPRSVRDSSEETRTRLQINEVQRWLDANRSGDSLASAYIDGGDARAYFLNCLGHFAQRRIAAVTDPNLAYFSFEDPVGLYQSSPALQTWLEQAMKEGEKKPNVTRDWNSMSAMRRQLWYLRAYAVAASHFAPSQHRVSAQEHPRNNVPWLVDHVITDVCEAWHRVSQTETTFSEVFPFVVVLGDRFVVTDTRISLHARSAAEAIACFVYIAKTNHGGFCAPRRPVYEPWNLSRH